MAQRRRAIDEHVIERIHSGGPGDLSHKPLDQHPRHARYPRCAAEDILQAIGKKAGEIDLFDDDIEEASVAERVDDRLRVTPREHLRPIALRVAEGATAYCASKFGVLGFSRALAAETRGRVGVTTLVPGGMDTHFFDDRPESYKPPADAKLNRPDDVAQAVLFALNQPSGCEVRELVVCQEYEGSWP